MMNNLNNIKELLQTTLNKKLYLNGMGDIPDGVITKVVVDDIVKYGQYMVVDATLYVDMDHVETNLINFFVLIVAWKYSTLERLLELFGPPLTGSAALSAVIVRDKDNPNDNLEISKPRDPRRIRLNYG